MVDCRDILDEIPYDFTKRMVSLAHELAPVDQIVHNPRFVSIGFLEHSYPHKDIVGRLRDEDEGGERRLVATDSAQSAFPVGDPRFVVGFAANVGKLRPKGLKERVVMKE